MLPLSASVLRKQGILPGATEGPNKSNALHNAGQLDAGKTINPSS